MLEIGLQVASKVPLPPSSTLSPSQLCASCTSSSCLHPQCNREFMHKYVKTNWNGKIKQVLSLCGSKWQVFLLCGIRNSCLLSILTESRGRSHPFAVGRPWKPMEWTTLMEPRWSLWLHPGGCIILMQSHGACGMMGAKDMGIQNQHLILFYVFLYDYQLADSWVCSAGIMSLARGPFWEVRYPTLVEQLE